MARGIAITVAVAAVALLLKLRQHPRGDDSDGFGIDDFYLARVATPSRAGRDGGGRAHVAVPNIEAAHG